MTSRCLPRHKISNEIVFVIICWRVTWFVSKGDEIDWIRKYFMSTKVNNKAEQQKHKINVHHASRAALKLSTIGRYNRRWGQRSCLLPIDWRRRKTRFAPIEWTIDFFFSSTHNETLRQAVTIKSFTRRAQEKDRKTHRHILNLNGFEQLQGSKLSTHKNFLFSWIVQHTTRFCESFQQQKKFDQLESIIYSWCWSCLIKLVDLKQENLKVSKYSNLNLVWWTENFNDKINLSILDDQWSLYIEANK